MRTTSRFRLPLATVFLLGAIVSEAQIDRQQDLDRKYQSAVAEYNAGHFDRAQSQLEGLLPFSKGSFAVHELLGLVYAAQSKDRESIEHLDLAVRLKPDSPEARTNLGASLLRTGKTEMAGEQFRKALELEPRDFDANHNLGEFLIESGKIPEARPFLEAAQEVRPGSYDNGYDLAQADFLTGRLDDSVRLIHSLLELKDTAELHNLLAQAEEKSGSFVAAAKDFETAAHLDPSEENLFDWGSELLLHRTYNPAIEVFTQASQRYPASARLRIGLGMTLDLVGKYDDAVSALLQAADLNPTDARCYLFLSKAYGNTPGQADLVIDRFRRYADLEPSNALAQYYFAMSLWKGKRAEGEDPDLGTVEALLRKAIALDGKFADAHVQLGSLYADRHEYAKSVPELTRALELDPNLPDAHYRLGQDYVHLGQKDRAQAEFDVYQRLRERHLAEIDKERAEVQQFVYEAKPGGSGKP